MTTPSIQDSPGHPSPTATEEPPDGSPNRVPAWLLIAVYALALVTLGVAQLGTHEVETAHDGVHYLQIARSLARGEGYVSYTHWALNLPKETLPHPDTYRAPLYPIMVAALARVVPDFIVAGKWVSVITGALVPPLVLLFSVGRLRTSLGFGLLAALIALTNHHLMIAGSRALTEAPYTAATLVSLYFLATPRPSPWRAGLAGGVACLIRYQGALLIPCALLSFVLRRGRPVTWVRRSLTFSGVFLIVVSPWLVRNQVVAGSPFYTDLKYHIISTYDPDRSFHQYFHGLTPPSEPISYMTKRLDRTVLLFGHRLWLLIDAIGRENAGNPLLLVFAIAGVAHVARGRMPTPRAARTRAGPDASIYALQVAAIFFALNIGLASLTFAKHRHLTSCDPFFAVLTVAGLAGALAWADGRGRLRPLVRSSLVALLALGIVTEGVRSVRKISRIEPRGLQHAQACAEIIGGDLPPGEAVMAESPYFFGYALDRPAVSLPWADDDGIRSIALRYHVRYLCLVQDETRSPYPNSFVDTGILPGWLHEVGRNGDVVVLGVDVEQAILAGDLPPK